MAITTVREDYPSKGIKMEVLSYYQEETGDKELLIEHIATALEVMEGAEDSRLFRLAEKIYHGLDFKQAVRLAIVFHDAGKIFYQSKRGEKGKRYMSFKGHEYFSTYIFNTFVSKLFEIDLENYERYGVIRDVCSFAIFFHHHAMNVRLRKPEMEESSVRFGMSLLEIFENYVRQFLDQKEVEALKKAVNEIKTRGAENLMRSLEVNVNSRVNSLWREIMQRRDLKKLSYLTLIVLTTADYLSAQKSRKGGKTTFSRALDDFYRFYL